MHHGIAVFTVILTSQQVTINTIFGFSRVAPPGFQGTELWFAEMWVPVPMVKAVEGGAIVLAEILGDGYPLDSPCTMPGAVLSTRLKVT